MSRPLSSTPQSTVEHWEDDSQDRLMGSELVGRSGHPPAHNLMGVGRDSEGLPGGSSFIRRVYFVSIGSLPISIS